MTENTHPRARRITREEAIELAALALLDARDEIEAREAVEEHDG